MDKHLAVKQISADFRQNNPVCTGRQVRITSQRRAIGRNGAKGIDIDNVWNIISTQLWLFRNVKIMEWVIDKGRERTAFVKLNSVRQEKCIEFAHPLADTCFAQAFWRGREGDALLKLNRNPMDGGAGTVICHLRYIEGLPCLACLGKVFDLFGCWVGAAVLCGQFQLGGNSHSNKEECFNELIHKVLKNR